MNKTITIIAILAIAFLAWVLVFSNAEAPTEGVGSLYVGVDSSSTDHEDIDALNVTVTKVELFNKQTGWNDIITTSQTFDLFSLSENGQARLWSPAQVDGMTYSQVRLTFGDVMISDESASSVNAITPADTLVIDVDVPIKTNATTSMIFSFDANQSILISEDGAYIFAPVVVTEVQKEADVTITEGETFTISNGTIVAAVTVGMDLEGESRPNFSVNPTTTINLDDEGAIVTDNDNSTSTQEDTNETTN